MKKIILLLIVSMLSIHTTIAQKLKGNKNVITENREIESFDSIIIKDKINVILEESPINKVRVETDENLLSAVETRINEEGVLEVFLLQEIGRSKELDVYIGVTDTLQYIEIQDNAKVTCENEIHVANLNIVSKDNARIKLMFRADDIKITGLDRSDMELSLSVDKDITVMLDHNSSLDFTGSANKISALLKDSSSFKASGNCKELVTTSSENTKLQGKELLSDYADVKISDRSDVYVNVAKELIIDAEKMSEIYIYGTPKLFVDNFSDKSSLYKK